MVKDDLKQAFGEVWSMLWDIPGPDRPSTLKLKVEQFNRYLLIMFPGLGLLAGIFTLAAAWLADRLPGRVAGTIIFAVVAVLLHEILSGGRNLSSLATLGEALSRRRPLLQGLMIMNEDIHAPRGTIGMVTLMALVMIRAVAFGTLFYYGRWAWMPVVFILAYAFQAHLATLPSLTSGKEIVTANDAQVATMWIVAGLVGIVIMAKGGFGAFFATLFAAALTAGISVVVKRFFAFTTEGITGNIIGALSYVAETLLLLFGIAFLIS